MAGYLHLSEPFVLEVDRSDLQWVSEVIQEPAIAHLPSYLSLFVTPTGCECFCLFSSSLSTPFPGVRLS